MNTSEDNVSGDIKQLIVKMLFKNDKLHSIDDFILKKNDDDLKCIMMSRNMKKIKFKLVKRYETRYSHLLLNKTFHDKFGRSQFGILHLST